MVNYEILYCYSIWEGWEVIKFGRYVGIFLIFYLQVNLFKYNLPAMLFHNIDMVNYHVQFSDISRDNALKKRLEVVLLFIVYLAYGYDDGSALSYILLTMTSWFMALSWLFAPYLFNPCPSGFEWQN
ncbi:callose synthase 9-like [Rosa chinensis]|uniref:callose synthase 9-like n=1 Tax=Rosa chinensis TaxID=74649 RepID=UPI001AD8AE36|nr:callose synthase 9-like [Rosa chinensis]